MPDRTDRLLDEIDSLVENSLSSGDTSGSYGGERYPSCPWCPEPWHGLPITEDLKRLRSHPYARDEFGYPVVDPDYRYSKDTSAWVCPGSDYHGPPPPLGVWDRDKRLAARLIPFQSDRKTWCFIGPFEEWEVTLINEMDYPDIGGRPGPTPIEQRDMATFTHNPLIMPWGEWLEFQVQNLEDVQSMIEIDGVVQVFMKPITFGYEHLTFSAQQGQQYPNYLEFLTYYDINLHPWWRKYWKLQEDPVQRGHRLIAESMQTVAPLLRTFE